MSTAVVVPARDLDALDQGVWLPIPLGRSQETTGFTKLEESQLLAIAGQQAVAADEMVSPDPLEMREVFAYRLEEDLRRTAGERPALEDFCLLVEGLAYGLLRPAVYDLHNHRLNLKAPEERYLTCLLFEPQGQIEPACAGSFAPATLVCPAANWRQRDQLKDAVLLHRNHPEGRRARGLLNAFRDNFRSSTMLWARALDRLLQTHNYETTGEDHQRNVGAFSLQANERGGAQEIFFPQYRHSYLEELATRLNAEHTDERDGGLRFYRQNQVTCVLSTLVPDHAKLFGFGCEVGNPPTGTSATDFRLREDTIEHLRRFANVYVGNGVPADYRFRLPDCLRCVISQFGRAGQLVLLPGDEVYSLGVLPLLRTGLPHERNREAGLHAEEGHSYWVEPLSSGKRAYYVETYETRTVGELTRLGQALWLIFVREADWDPARKEALRRGQRILLLRDEKFHASPDLDRQRPDHRSRAVDLLTAVHCLGQLPPGGLLAQALRTYLGDYCDRFPPGPGGPVEPVYLGSYTWNRLAR